MLQRVFVDNALEFYTPLHGSTCLGLLSKSNVLNVFLLGVRLFAVMKSVPVNPSVYTINSNNYRNKHTDIPTAGTHPESL